MTGEDIAYYIVARYNTRLEEESIDRFKTNHNIYTLAGLIYRFIGTLFSKNANVPKYDEVFKNDNEENSVITSENAFAYLVNNSSQDDNKKGGEV